MLLMLLSARTGADRVVSDDPFRTGSCTSSSLPLYLVGGRPAHRRDSQDTFCCKSGRGDRASPVGDDRQFLCTASPRSDNRVHLFAGSAQVYSLCGVLHVRVGLSLLREPGSIRRPSPYEGDVLPTELPRIVRMVVLAS